jgi:SAM-dependent methyltransferase
MTDPVEQLVTAIRDSIDDQTFQKLTLGKFQTGPPSPEAAGLRRDGVAVQHVYVRIVDLKAGPHLSFVYRYPNQDFTKNSPIPEGIKLLAGWLGSTCRSATLLTSKGRQQLLFGRRGQPRLFSQDSPSIPGTSRAHDREKTRQLSDERALELLGVIDSQGRPRAQMGNKYRQVHHFIEALAPILKGTSPGETLHIIDMGCGKGYLTFAFHQFLSEKGKNPVTVGVEKRGSLVDSANAIAGQLGENNIRFIQGEINDVEVKPIDILIALHACDTATDDAIYRGIQEECRWIVVSPCCQHELRPQLTAPAGLEPLFRHGVQVDRMTETVTDTLRCLYLEAWGYQTRIQEFVGTEHTAKNLLIVASRTRRPGPSQDLVERTLEFQHRFGIQNQRLGALLVGNASVKDSTTTPARADLSSEVRE